MDEISKYCPRCGETKPINQFYKCKGRKHGVERCPGTVVSNMVPACLSCNSSKNDCDPHEWLNNKFGERKAKQILKRIGDYFDGVTDK